MFTKVQKNRIKKSNDLQTKFIFTIIIANIIVKIINFYHRIYSLDFGSKKSAGHLLTGTYTIYS